MSKIGKKIIEIPEGVTVELQGKMVKVTGPKGNLEFKHNGKVDIKIEDKQITVASKDDTTQFQGLYRTLINNLITGVKEGISKTLEFQGIGYKANVNGSGDLVLNVGYSHPVEIKKIPGVEYSVSENTIVIKGIDKVLVGDMAAKIRAVRPPEPYKGKGIRYLGEKIIRKETKSV